MANTSSAELYLKITTEGVIESSKTLEALAKTAANAGKEARLLSTAIGQAQFRRLSQEAAAATKELERMQRIARDGQFRVFLQDLGGPLSRGLAQLGQVSRAGQTAFGLLAGGVGGFVTAGMQGTAESIQLSQAMREVNLQIASIFTPQIHKAIDAVQRLAQALRNLTGRQQESARQWVAGGLALTGFLSLLGGRGLPGVGGIPLIGGALGSPVGAMLAVVASSREGREAMMELARATAPLVSSFAQLAPLVAGLAKVVAAAITWIVNKVPGLKEEGTGLFGNAMAAAAAILGTYAGGPGVGTAAAVGGKVAGEAVDQALGVSKASGEVRALRAMIEKARQQLEFTGWRMQPAERRELEEFMASRQKRLAALEGRAPAEVAREQLTPHVPGFETPADLYKRIAEVASGQKDPEKETAENTRVIRGILEGIAAISKWLGQNVPADRPGDA